MDKKWLFSSVSARAVAVLMALGAGLVGAGPRTLMAEPAPAGVGVVTPAVAPTRVCAEGYRNRLDKIRAGLPQITALAEQVADRWVSTRQTMLHYPFGGDGSNFSMEMTSRAGGLANALPNTIRIKERSSADVILYSARSWEKGAEFIQKDMAKTDGIGWMRVVFGSRAGAPSDLPPGTVIVDNFASGGAEDEATVNQIVNCVNGWLFQCELVAALTRRSVRPSVLHGMCLIGATEHNKAVQDSKPTLFPHEKPVPAGALGTQFLDRLAESLKDLDTEPRKAQIRKAASIAVDTYAAGHQVYMSSFTHVLDGEVFVNNYAPTIAFRGISCGPDGETFRRNLRPGDLLFWFGEWTNNLPWLDYLKVIRSTGADYIPSYRVGNEPLEPMEHDDVYYDRKTGDAKMVLDQVWPLDGAVVDIPFAPGKMAPVTGVYVMLLYRALDEEIARQMIQRGVTPAPKPQLLPKPAVKPVAP